MISEQTIDRPVDDSDQLYEQYLKEQHYYCRFDGATKVEDCTCNDSRNQYGEDND